MGELRGVGAGDFNGDGLTDVFEVGNNGYSNGGSSPGTFALTCDRGSRADMPWDYMPLKIYQQLLAEEGLFLGGSAALNVLAAARVARTLPAGSVVVTILCEPDGSFLLCESIRNPRVTPVRNRKSAGVSPPKNWLKT